jgi:adenosylcobinamide kinase / adenosylcobinamide-phosphate guanylyltransferase
MTVTLLIGGARSGKSSLAVTRVLNWQRGDGEAVGQKVGGEKVGSDGKAVVFVATGSAGDGEMADRIARHQAERPASWATVEAPLDLVAGVRTACGLSSDGADSSTVAPRSENGPALIVDCLSMWVANHLMAPEQPFTEDPLSASEDTGPYDNPVEVDWDAAEAELLRQVEACFALLRTRSAPTWFVTNEVGLSLVPMNAMGRRYRDILGRVNAKVSMLADEAFLTVAGRVLRLERP